MNLTGVESNEIKIGTRVPVVSGTGSKPVETQYQYVDVGTNIWAQLRDRGDEWVLVVRSEVSNLDTTSNPEQVGVNAPVIRQIKISGSTLLVVGKPILIGSMDDPNSKRQFQLEVTITKLR
jgi:type II secretory pathway component GspD/PulD (secretin)